MRKLPESQNGMNIWTKRDAMKPKKSQQWNNGHKKTLIILKGDTEVDKASGKQEQAKGHKISPPEVEHFCMTVTSHLLTPLSGNMSEWYPTEYAC